MGNSFFRRVIFGLISLFALLGSLYYLYLVFYPEPPKPQPQVKPDVEIHYGGPPMQEKEK